MDENREKKSRRQSNKEGAHTQECRGPKEHWNIEKRIGEKKKVVSKSNIMLAGEAKEEITSSWGRNCLRVPTGWRVEMVFLRKFLECF